MKEAGCFAVWLGVESGSQPVLDAMRKGITPAQTIRAFKWAKEVGLMTVANVILGFPGETKETIWETIKFIDRIKPDDVGYYIATPYPGTPLYEKVVKEGLLLTNDFNKFDTATPVFNMGTMTGEELRELRERAFQRFYSAAWIFLKHFRQREILEFLNTTYNTGALPTGGNVPAWR